MQRIPVTSDIELRAFVTGDAAVLFAAIERNRQWLRRWLPWLHDDYSIEDTRAFLADCVMGNASGISLTTGIWSGGIFCGAIGLHKIDLLHRNTSIGYWLDQGFSGKGIMTGACRAMVSEGFTNYRLHRIEIRCAAGNTASCAIPRRLGFHEEGLLREAEWLYDHWVDLKLFAVINDTWCKEGYGY